ncbi:hypothetical protein PGTUg99_033020 [Puccinia graminis f. sp. tritici]|uniref:Uncharacterized protein n=1 Tax=Puccinia graminis f. sp. tritici TaxID=56615 RepID=A0A5B0S223_PUCGR|nr:hypothetical protein PGTUg99_033020 [Puccinia graminis f. sp. tritici]
MSHDIALETSVTACQPDAGDLKDYRCGRTGFRVPTNVFESVFSIDRDPKIRTAAVQ